MRLWSQVHPLINVAGCGREVISKRGEAAVTDASPLQAPFWMRLIQNQAVFVTPKPGVDPLLIQKAGKSYLELRSLSVELGKRLVVGKENQLARSSGGHNRIQPIHLRLVHIKVDVGSIETSQDPFGILHREATGW